jgi:hypothetical protein
MNFHVSVGSIALFASQPVTSGLPPEATNSTASHHVSPISADQDWIPASFNFRSFSSASAASADILRPLWPIPKSARPEVAPLFDDLISG